MPNPFSGKSYPVSLKAEDAAAIVFWSKNYKPFISTLEKIESIYQNRFLFHFTINGFQNPAKELFEPNIPDYQDAVKWAGYLSERYGKDTVLWRFDPIIFSSLTPPDERLATFENLASSLTRYVSRCIISFIDLYRKVHHRFTQISRENGIQFHKPALSELVDFSKELQKIATCYNIEILTCCENNIAETAGIRKGHCIDSELLHRLYPSIQFSSEIKPTRKGCGCYASRDIGSYNSCRHRCLYCYATNYKMIL